MGRVISFIYVKNNRGPSTNRFSTSHSTRIGSDMISRNCTSKRLSRIKLLIYSRRGSTKTKSPEFEEQIVMI